MKNVKTGVKGLLAIVAGFVILGLMWTFIYMAFIGKEKIKEGSNQMEFNSATVNLMVNNVNKTVEYYEDIFGFNLAMTVPEEGEYNWAMIERDNVQIMFQKEESLVEDLPIFKDRMIGGSFTIFIDVNSIDELYEKAKEKIVVVEDLKKTFYGMKEFTIEDLNGYIITFAERVDTD